MIPISGRPGPGPEVEAPEIAQMAPEPARPSAVATETAKVDAIGTSEPPSESEAETSSAITTPEPSTDTISTGTDTEAVGSVPDGSGAAVTETTAASGTSDQAAPVEAEAAAPETAAPQPEVSAKAEPEIASVAPSTLEEAAPAVAGTEAPVAGPVAADAIAPAPESPAPEALAAAPDAPRKPEGAASAPTVIASADDPVESADALRLIEPGADVQPDAADLPPPPPLTPAEEALLKPAPIDAAPIVPDVGAAPAAQPSVDPSGVPADPEPSADPEAMVIVPEPDLDDILPESLEPDEPAPLDTALPPTGFEGEVAGVTTNRLPRIGDAPAAEVTDAAPETTVDDLPAMVRFARPFENPSQKPTFAVILVDTGGPDVDRTTLAALPFPVTFAIDPTAPDAVTAAAIYRAAGQEVVMLATGIPPGATASDLEVTFQAHAAALPEAVAVLDLEQGGFQNDRPLATQVVPVIKGQGRALLTWDKGLNAGDQVARREGLASALVFRRLDAEGESAPTLRRYLDRAAFKAAQDGRVVVVGETRPETVAALLEWTVEGRASTVVLAPITAVLQAN